MSAVVDIFVGKDGHTSNRGFHNLSLPAPGPARVPAATDSISGMRKTDPVYSGIGIACASPATRYVNHWLSSEKSDTRFAIEYEMVLYKLMRDQSNRISRGVEMLNADYAA